MKISGWGGGKPERLDTAVPEGGFTFHFPQPIYCRLLYLIIVHQGASDHSLPDRLRGQAHNRPSRPQHPRHVPT